jgi:4-amino-4-deoxy-L-arabinose transferase-like glycosyltransferase
LQRSSSVLVLLAALTFTIGLGRPAISDTDEGFYAEAAREMVESGDWLTPHFNYADRWQKPPLYYWTAASAYLVTGPTEWSARWFSALSGIGLVLLTWLAARRLLRDEGSAFLAGAMVATCYGYFYMARQALPDLPLTFFITAAIWCVLDRRWSLAGLAAGLGFLTKGPVALVVPALVLLPIWWHERRWPRFRDLALAGAVAAVVGVPWYLAMTAQHGTAYLDSFFVGDNLERFATTRYNDPRFALYYVPIVVGGMLPWAFYLIVLPWRRGVDVLRRRQSLATEEWQLAAWALAPLIFYTLSVGKQPRYVLPVLPPIAILLARSLMKRVNASDRHQRGLSIATWLTSAFFFGIAVMLLNARPLFLTAVPAATYLAIGAMIGAGIALAWVAWRRAWPLLPNVMAATSLLALLSLQFGALAGVRPEPVEEMAVLVNTHRTSEAVGEYQVFVRNLVFYTGVKQTELFNETLALQFVKSPERVLLVARARDVERLEAIGGSRLTRLGAVRYVDTANIKLRTLLWPLPEQDIDTVLLVANR